MKVVIQKVRSASVAIIDNINGEIKEGLVVFVGFKETDNIEIIKWMCNKIINLRVFKDNDNKLNLSLLDKNAELLVISNFTLYGDASHGFRPSFSQAAKSEISKPLYDYMIEQLQNYKNINIQTGIFGSMMEVSLVNDGPITIILEKD